MPVLEVGPAPGVHADDQRAQAQAEQEPGRPDDEVHERRDDGVGGVADPAVDGLLEARQGTREHDEDQ